jgi:hypothetical protein
VTRWSSEGSVTIPLVAHRLAELAVDEEILEEPAGCLDDELGRCFPSRPGVGGLEQADAAVSLP